MENKKGVSNTFWIILIGVCAILIILIGVGFALFSNREEKIIEKTENGGQVFLNYTSDISGLSIRSATPTIDSVGMQSLESGNYFDFSVEVTLDEAASIEYELSAIKDEYSTISDNDIRIYLEKEVSGSYTKIFDPSPFIPITKETEIGSEVGSMVLNKERKQKTSTDNYRLRMWLSDKSLLTDGNYNIEIVVKGRAS